MTTTADIARTHGYTGPLVCRGCGTAEQLHYLVWGDPETGESGDFVECCACGIKEGDPAAVHADCEPDDFEDDDLEDDMPDDAAGPTVRVFHKAAGWVMTGPQPEECTTRYHRERDGRPACTGIAVWKVVQDHGMHLTIGFYCDADLPAEHQPERSAA